MSKLYNEWVSEQGAKHRNQKDAEITRLKAELNDSKDYARRLERALIRMKIEGCVPHDHTKGEPPGCTFDINGNEACWRCWIEWAKGGPNGK